MGKAWVAKHTGLPSFEVSGKTWRVTRDNGILVSTGSGVAYVSDPGAPLDRRVQYKIDSAGGHATHYQTRRNPFPGSKFVITSWDGRLKTPVAVINNDEVEHDLHATLMQPVDRPTPVVRYGAQPSVEGRIEFRSDTAGTKTLRTIFAGQAPVWILHSHAECDLRSCDIPESRLVVPSRAVKESRTRRVDEASRKWALDYAVLAPDQLGGVPTVSYAEATAAGFDYGDGSYVDALKQIAGMA